MSWEEVVILCGSLIANAALIPTIRDPAANVPFRTSAMTASILVVQTTMFLSLGLLTTAAGTAVGTACWGLILFVRSDWRFSVGSLGGEATDAGQV